MRHFNNIRITSWEPEYVWVETLEKAADYINQPHEDYPQRVKDTEIALSVSSGVIYEPAVRLLHRFIFEDLEDAAGNWRRANVTVGLHRPPDYDLIPKMMDELFWHYRHLVETIERLKEWYWDFETIHPFVDGNGRVGGVMLALNSHRLYPEKGYLVGDPHI